MTDSSIKSFLTPFGSRRLSRYPRNAPASLQAWDSADNQLLLTVAEHLSLKTPESLVIWILNDSFGALTTALADYQPWMISDSAVAHQACRLNHQLNQLPLDETRLISDQALLPGSDQRIPKPDIVLFKPPKILHYWEYQLATLRPHLAPTTFILGAAMAKHLPKSLVNLTEKVLGSANPSLTIKKARLISCQFNPEPPTTSVQSNHQFIKNYDAPEFGLRLENHPNLFSRDKLDIGTRFMLEKIPALLASSNINGIAFPAIIDMACGNGALGIYLGKQLTQASILFTDESYLAIESAKLNAASTLAEQHCDFLATNCLEGVADQSADLIINNPPFHQQHVVGDYIARNMFKEAFRTLRNAGELWVVANRQLGYHLLLKRLFGHCETVTGNSKFVILRAIKAG